MYIRRKAFSVATIDGEEKLFSTKDRAKKAAEGTAVAGGVAAVGLAGAHKLGDKIKNKIAKETEEAGYKSRKNQKLEKVAEKLQKPGEKVSKGLAKVLKRVTKR
ncbi:MAG: hypothetical protein J6I84_04760 [Bacilli bacterium]|nr:hypothetical protein [Bacilli bacterium]